MKINKKILFLGLLILLLAGGAISIGILQSKAASQHQTITVKDSNLASTITSTGDVEAENQVTMTFLAAGRVAYLGVKVGDSVQKGEVLANLDTTIAGHNFTAAQAAYNSAQASLAKVLDDIHLFQYGNGGFANVGSANETQTQKTQRQEAQAAVDSAYDNMQSARDQLSLESIVAPFNGTVLSINNIEPGINVTPVSGSSITVAGGGNLKFVADINEQDRSKISVGQSVTITLDATRAKKLAGTITRIDDSKTNLPDGRSVFKTDIGSNDLESIAQAGEGGSVQIQVKTKGVVVVPSWTILGDKYIWVIEGGKPVLKEVTVGQTLDGKTSVVSGVSPNDVVILDPEIIAKDKYKLL